MTIKKLALSTVAAAMVTTSASATGGTLAITNAQTVGAESLVAAKNHVNSVDINTTYTVNILGSISTGSVIYTISGVDINSSNAAAVSVFNAGSGSTFEEVTSGCANGAAGQIICDVNGTITSGDVLYLSDANNSGTTNPGGYAWDVNTTAGFTSATISAQLTNSATTEIDSGTAVTFLTATTEWSASVTTPFASTIDASDSFLSFQSDANATITISQTAVDLGSATPAFVWSVMPDSNVSAFGTVTMTGAVTQGRDNNYTMTGGAAALAAGVYQMDFTPDTTNAIAESSFTTGLTATFNSNAVNLIAANSNFGTFTTYGYTGNIPGASYSAGITDTIITLVNDQAAATADTVVVLTDADGDSCTLTSSTDAEVTKPTANSSTKYTLSTMLGNAGCSALTGTSYAIQITLPTTPSNVFANAFVKNSSINQFKVLPVYSNGTSY